MLPTMLARAATPERVAGGFEEAGMCDPVTGKPAFEKMLGTCRRDVSQEELDLVYRVLDALLQVQFEKGYIDDETFDAHGIADDKNEQGEVVRRPADISNEPCQRAKCL